MLTARAEVTDRMLIFGERHLRLLLAQYAAHYEIDLNAKHAQQLRDALAAYVRAGRRVSGGSRTCRPRRPAPALDAHPTKPRTAPTRHTLLARSRHVSVRTLERYARPGPEAVARHVAATDPAARRRPPAR